MNANLASSMDVDPFHRNAITYDLLSPELIDRILTENHSFQSSDSNDLTYIHESSENSVFSSQSHFTGFEIITNVTDQQDSISSSQHQLTQYPAVSRSSNNIQIVVQPKATQRPCYLSDFIDKPPRYIRAIQYKENGKTYDYPAIWIPPCYLIPDQAFYLRVSLTTVELENRIRYIHPYSLEIPKTDNHSDILRCHQSILYPIRQNDVDSNGIMTFNKLMVIKTVQERLKEYGNLFSFETNEECPNTKKCPKKMISDYQLKKSQLAFTVVKFLGQDSFECIETLFSDVMSEMKEGQAEVQNIQICTATPVFQDGFIQDGAVDLNKWVFVEGTGENGWGTHQEQYYTQNVERNAHCKNKRLIIEARRESYKGSKFTSARLRSKQTFLYGRLQIRAKLPSAKGVWSSFVLLPAERTYGNAIWPENGEINILSHFGRNPSRIESSVSTKLNNPLRNNLPMSTVEVADATTQFKIYTLLWAPDQIEIFVRSDEANALERRIFIWEKLNRDWTSWPFDKPFYLEIYLAVGGDVAGNQIDEDQFPQQIEIDYVRFDERK